MNTVKFNVTPLQTLRRQVGELGAGRAQVGLFADTAGRVSDPGRMSENPSLGFEQEFGNPEHNLPERSFLRMPLMTQLGAQILAKGQSWIYLLRMRGAKRTLALLGALGEDVVQESFATAGFGQWPELKRETVRRKGSSRILIESAQMRKAVAYRVI